MGSRRSGHALIATTAPPILSGPLAAYKAPQTFPPAAGTDSFESIAEVGIQSGCTDPVLTGGAAGPTVVQRKAPQDTNADGKPDTINTEIVSMNLTGYVPRLGPITIQEDPTLASTGKVKDSSGASNPQNFPANSFFDVFFEIDVPIGTLHNSTPVHMSNGKILSIPPFGSEYVGGAQPVQLLDSQNAVVACLVHLSHVPEDPSHALIKRELFGIEQRLDEIANKVGAMIEV